MDLDTQRRLRGTFDRAAASYASARPSYPRDAVEWLVAESSRVLDLGAGAGALTSLLAARTPDLFAAEPSPNLAAELRAATGVTRVVLAGAEALPFGDRSFDVVTVATAFHWFDPATALPELARVIRPGGVLSLVWNTRDLSTATGRGLEDLLRAARPAGLGQHLGPGAASVLSDSPLFEPPSTAEFPHVQRIDRRGFVDLAGSRSYVIALDPADRARTLRAAGDLFDAQRFVDDTGTWCVEVPYVAVCFQARRRD